MAPTQTLDRPPARTRLSQRERDVLQQICIGLTNEQIALRLDISRETVKSHVRGILRKLGVDSRARAVGCVLSALAIDRIP